jgi:hypothetical protein
MEEAAIQDYCNKHASTIEEGLGSAVDKAVQEGAPHPLSSIAKELLVSRRKVGKRQLQNLLDHHASIPEEAPPTSGKTRASSRSVLKSHHMSSVHPDDLPASDESDGGAGAKG